MQKQMQRERSGMRIKNNMNGRKAGDIKPSKPSQYQTLSFYTAYSLQTRFRL